MTTPTVNLVNVVQQILKHKNKSCNSIDVAPMPLYDIIEYMIEQELLEGVDGISATKLYVLLAPFCLDGPYDSRMGFYLLKYRMEMCIIVRNNFNTISNEAELKSHIKKAWEDIESRYKKEIQLRRDLYSETIEKFQYKKLLPISLPGTPEPTVEQHLISTEHKEIVADAFSNAKRWKEDIEVPLKALQILHEEFRIPEAKEYRREIQDLVLKVAADSLQMG